MSLSRRMNQQALGTLARVVGWALLVLLLCLVINYYRPDHNSGYVEEHYYPDYRKTLVNGIYTDKDTKWRDQQFHKKGRPLELTTTTGATTPERQADETTTTPEGEVTTTIAKALHSKTVTSEKPTTQETAAEASDRKTTTEEHAIEVTTVENTDRKTTTEEQTKEKTTATSSDSKTTRGERVIEETTAKTSDEETTAGEQANEKTTNVASDEATGKPANEDTPGDGHTTKTIDDTSGRHVTPKRGKGKGTNDIENTTETPGDTSTNGNIGKSTDDYTGSKSKAQAEAILRKGMVRNKPGQSKQTEKESFQSGKRLKVKNGTNDDNEDVREALAELENDKEQINNKKVGDKAPETGSIKNKGKIGKDIGKELASDENMIDKDDRGVVKGEAGEDGNIENGSINNNKAKVRIGIKSERAIAKALDTFLAEKEHFNDSEVDDTMVKKRAVKNKLQTLLSGANV